MSVTALVPRGASATGHGLAEKHRRALDNLLHYDNGEVNAYTALIPEEELTELVAEIEVRLRPAPLGYVKGIVDEMYETFKRAPDTIPNPPAFKAGITLALSRFSGPVLVEAYRRALDVFEWVPSAAPIVGLCSAVENEFRAHLRVLQRMAAEHQRRREEAKNAREKALYKEEFWNSVAAQIGESYAANDGLRLAERRWSWRDQHGWPVMWSTRAANGDKEWVTLGRKLSVVSRAVAAQEKGRAEPGHVVAVTGLAVRDEAAALRAVQALEAGELAGIASLPDAPCVDLESVLQDIGREYGLVLSAGRFVTRRDRPWGSKPPSEAEDSGAKSIKLVAEALRGFRFPDPSDPRVQARLRNMESLATGVTATVPTDSEACPCDSGPGQFKAEHPVVNDCGKG